MPTVCVNGVRLNYVQLGDGTAREDLVMVHGLATNLAFWYMPYAVEFSQRFRVTVFDLRGHGRSAMPPAGYTPSVLGRDLAGLMDGLGINRAHLVAHSFGGVVAMNFACEQPDRVCSLILADSHVSAMRHVDEQPEWLFGRRIQAILDRHGMRLDTRDPYFGYLLLTRVAQLQLRNEPVPDELLDLLGPVMGRTGARTAAQWLRLMTTGSAEQELMGDDGLLPERLRAFGFPILAMYGDNSQARTTGNWLANVWPRAEFRRVREAGHFFPATRQDEVMSLCRRFWSGEFAADRRRYRTGEGKRGWFRSDRIHRSGDEWYLDSRECHGVGPFGTVREAEAALKRLGAGWQA